MKETTAPVLNEAEKERLLRLLETTPFLEISSAVIEHRNKLLQGGFGKYQATELAMQLHEYLMGAIFSPSYND